MTTTLRSYDHYAPGVAATVLPGAVVPSGPRWTGTAPLRRPVAGTTIELADGATLPTTLTLLEGRLGAYALVPGAVGDVYGESSWLASDHLGAEWPLTQVLAQGYPSVGLEELRRRLRRAGYRVAADELTIAHAVAGTQAAVWRVTTGRDLATSMSPAVSHLYEYLLARTGLPGYGSREHARTQGPSFFVAGVSAVEVRGADAVDDQGRTLAGLVLPGQRFHLRGRADRITLRHGAVRARLLSGDGVPLVTVTAQPPVVVEHAIG